MVDAPALFPMESGINLGFLEDLAKDVEASVHEQEQETAIAEQEDAKADDSTTGEDEATTLEKLMAEEAVNTPHQDVEDDPDAVPWTPPSRSVQESGTFVLLTGDDEPKGFLARMWYRLRRMLDLQ